MKLRQSWRGRYVRLRRPSPLKLLAIESWQFSVKISCSRVQPFTSANQTMKVVNYLEVNLLLVSCVLS